MLLRWVVLAWRLVFENITVFSVIAYAMNTIFASIHQATCSDALPDPPLVPSSFSRPPSSPIGPDYMSNVRVSSGTAHLGHLTLSPACTGRERKRSLGPPSKRPRIALSMRPFLGAHQASFQTGILQAHYTAPGGCDYLNSPHTYGRPRRKAYYRAWG